MKYRQRKSVAHKKTLCLKKTVYFFTIYKYTYEIWFPAGEGPTKFDPISIALLWSFFVVAQHGKKVLNKGTFDMSPENMPTLIF